MILSLRKSINGLKKDREHGAGWLTVQALEILREAASLDQAVTTDKLLASLAAVTAALLEARPAMIGHQITIAQALSDKMKLSPEQIAKACKLGECK